MKGFERSATASPDATALVTLAERHGGIHIDRALFETMVEEVAGHVAAFAANNAHLRARRAVHMLGTSGTVTTVAGSGTEGNADGVGDAAQLATAVNGGARPNFLCMAGSGKCALAAQ